MFCAVRGSVCRILGGLEGENHKLSPYQFIMEKGDTFIFKGIICNKDRERESDIISI